jgi:hypothetical protein
LFLTQILSSSSRSAAHSPSSTDPFGDVDAPPLPDRPDQEGQDGQQAFADRAEAVAAAEAKMVLEGGVSLSAVPLEVDGEEGVGSSAPALAPSMNTAFMEDAELQAMHGPMKKWYETTELQYDFGKFPMFWQRMRTWEYFAEVNKKYQRTNPAPLGLLE